MGEMRHDDSVEAPRQSLPLVILFEHCRFEADPTCWYAQTVFHDATFVPATPQDKPYYRYEARCLGYGSDVWRVSWEHEIAHLLLARHRRERPRALWNVAHGIDEPGPVGLEERAVLAVKALRNSCIPPPDYIERNGFEVSDCRGMLRHYGIDDPLGFMVDAIEEFDRIGGAMVLARAATPSVYVTIDLRAA
jgi:hypothetical protein